MVDEEFYNKEERLKYITEAVETAVYRWRRYCRDASVLGQADNLLRLQNAMSDLTSWLPGYDYNTDTLPWEREDLELA